MIKLAIHTDCRKKSDLFRKTRRSTFLKDNWDVINTKENLIAFLTQFKPDLICIGPLPSMTEEEVAFLLRQLYRAAKARVPALTCVDKTMLPGLRRIVHN
jgi:hypothetical protein